MSDTSLQLILIKRDIQLGLELASQSYQCKLQEQSHLIDLLSIQIDKYETTTIVKLIDKQFFIKAHLTLLSQYFFHSSSNTKGNNKANKSAKHRFILQ